jgi:acetyltransferase
VLDLRSAESVRSAVAGLGGGPVLVARQVAPGVEVLCGMTRDPDFGPVLAVGSGGAAVETLGRVALAVAPLDAAIAQALVEDAGIEDASGVVAATLVGLSQLAIANPRIESVDVNPLILGPEGAVAVDALVVTQPDDN